jgi:exosome complex exonuclease DIS3/RRP44
MSVSALEPKIKSVLTKLKHSYSPKDSMLGTIDGNITLPLEESNQMKHDLSDSPDIMIFVPVDKQVPPIFIRTQRRAQLTQQRILVAIDDWPVTSIFPWGHYVSSIGDVGDKEVETFILLHEFG